MPFVHKTKQQFCKIEEIRDIARHAHLQITIFAQKSLKKAIQGADQQICFLALPIWR